MIPEESLPVRSANVLELRVIHRSGRDVQVIASCTRAFGVSAVLTRRRSSVQWCPRAPTSAAWCGTGAICWALGRTLWRCGAQRLVLCQLKTRGPLVLSKRWGREQARAVPCADCGGSGACSASVYTVEKIEVAWIRSLNYAVGTRIHTSETKQ